MELKSSMTTKKNYKTTYKRRICRKWRIKYYLSESKALGKCRYHEIPENKTKYRYQENPEKQMEYRKKTSVKKYYITI